MSLSVENYFNHYYHSFSKLPDLVRMTTISFFKKVFHEEQTIKVYMGKGCKMCHGTGYQGRLGIFEVLEVTNTIKELIVEKKDSDTIEAKAVEEGMTTMLDDGLEKVARGITTVEEVLRVTKVETS